MSKKRAHNVKASEKGLYDLLWNAHVQVDDHDKCQPMKMIFDLIKEQGWMREKNG